MATGYTHEVMEGKVTDFPTFAMNCARAFGACISLRDESADTPIPDEFKPSTYNADRIKEDEAKMAALLRMSREEIVAAYEDWYANQCASRADSRDERKREEQRYQAMMHKVLEWQPPTPEHEGLKTFMRDQIAESQKWDCGDRDYLKDPPREDPMLWHAKNIAGLERDIARNRESQAEEEDRCAKRTAWVRDLRNSLKAL